MKLKTKYGFEELMMRAAEKIFGNVPDKRTLQQYIGPVEKCYLGYAASEELRRRAASGGLVSAFLTDLLEDGLIQGALISRTVSRNGKIEGEPFIARTREDILSGQSSIYMQFPATQRIKELILQTQGPLAIVALPCHLNQIRLWEKKNPALAEKIRFRISLICGRNSSKKLLQQFLCNKGIEERDVAEILFRQGHWRGEMKLTLQNGQKISFPFQDFSIYRNLHFYCEMKCLHCEDPLGKYGDMTCGDAWLPALKQHPVKHSIVIARTSKAVFQIENMMRKNCLIMQRIPSETIFQAQRRVLIPAMRGKEAKARLSPFFNFTMKYKGNWKSMWNDYLVSGMTLLNYRLSRSQRFGLLIFNIPPPILRIYLLIMSLLKNF